MQYYLIHNTARVALTFFVIQLKSLLPLYNNSKLSEFSHAK
ncbi:hypothetical protein [uncultured Gammaproteobacteria bacterium]|nr:hypothetical protein [uncultured Gammaproteobacteria bacterium]CAC9547126.1 hypothetical protein [uncultured Gammaproteobacteria bacterium]CAC9556570.1 hypothetical protein [uncultured Gammaproteobacteria bacterium]CAC9561175.1 hypothetical protein [uncultured Gammaproteobacteria bacterium]CAC9949844.1 hypothetical protein [uncultured Gammaproteobacteria bacterium]